MKIFQKIKKSNGANEVYLFGIKVFSYRRKKYAAGGIRIGKTSSVDAQTTVGAYTYIGEHCGITRAQIGRYVSIGNNVSIGPGEHDLSRVSTSSWFYERETCYEQLTKQPCIIGHDVWIGVDAIIRRGVRIGNGAVVGANSFVNKDVPDFAIVAGTPARIIRYRFPEPVRQMISDSAWWDKDIEEAEQLTKELERKIALLEA